MQQQIASLLKQHDIRPSLQRLQIFEYLLKYKTHPTVDMIYSDLAPVIPTLSKTTVYNTLKTFAEHKLIQTLTIENDELRYDADMSEHIHFKCNSCNAVYDIFSDKSFSGHELPQGFTAEKIQLCVWGICSQCAQGY